MHAIDSVAVEGLADALLNHHTILVRPFLETGKANLMVGPSRCGVPLEAGRCVVAAARRCRYKFVPLPRDLGRDLRVLGLSGG
jgi:hypothetical protein